MRNDLSDITLVVDRSGSMQSCKDDAEGGINSFVEEQKKVEGEANLTLVQFDTEYEFVHNGVSIKDVSKFSLQPRGGTALLDAVGRSIVETGARLDKLSEEDKPGCVIFVIVTDGHENSSKEFNLEGVKKSIETQRKDYNWQFIFLGADENAFDAAMSMGISSSSAAFYDPNKKAGKAYEMASSNVSRMRGQSISGQSLNAAFTSEERSEIK